LNDKIPIVTVRDFGDYCECPLSADTVAKGIFVSWRTTLIQELDASRKIDSNGALVGF